MERVAAVNDITVGLEIEREFEAGREPTRHTTAIETTIYRLVQEALTNVIKHSGASHVDVTVSEDHDTVQITVSDDGHGFDPTVSVDGFGLAGMHERVSLVGGELVVGSSSGGGTTVRASIPAVRVAPALRGVSQRAV